MRTIAIAMMRCGMAAALLAGGMRAEAAGLLKPKGGGDGARIKAHAVDVTLNNGFARTEVDQTFANDSEQDVEAVYTFPLPKQASLSETSLWIDGKESVGEVVEKEKARKIYEKEKAEGRETALAEKNDFKTFDVSVGRVPAGGETRVRIVYYQPIEIDLNVGRYVYPIAEGGVDDERIAFWSVDDKVDGPFTFRLRLKSAFPVADVRVPGLEGAANVSRVGDGEGAETIEVRIDRAEGAALDRDVVVYYKLDDAVPARVEVIPYRESAGGEGTLMAVVTPAASLRRIQEGTDWVFVLDVSGSMGGDKIATLANGVGKVIGQMGGNDRFNVVTFNDRASDFTGGFVAATPDNARAWIERVKGMQASGGTALFAGLEKGYKALDADRTSGIILVTDGVCNVGPTAHSAFLDLLKKYDVRLFTFVIGNSGNQPLMERLALDSGGFAMNVSTGDDIVGRLLQAKAKVLHECLHDVTLKFRGERVYDVAPSRLGNVYAGQQMVVFGRYKGTGPAELELTARISGERKTWTCKFDLDETDTENPEIERLWALAGIDEAMQEIREKGESGALRDRVVRLGLDYSLVTDYTSMVVASDETFEGEGIGRANAERVRRERQAQQVRETAPVRQAMVDGGQTFGNQPSPGISLGTGPVGPLFAALAVWMARRRRGGAGA